MRHYLYYTFAVICLAIPFGFKACVPRVSGGIDNATYNTTTGDIGGSVNFDVEFRETYPGSKKFIEVRIPKKIPAETK